MGENRRPMGYVSVRSMRRAYSSAAPHGIPAACFPTHAVVKAAGTLDQAREARYLAAQQRWLAIADNYYATANGVATGSPSLVHRARNDDLLHKARVLQQISTCLIQEDDIHALYERIVDGAIDLMDADLSSMQVFDAEKSELRLLAWRGFHPDSAGFWDRMALEEGHSSCAIAFGSGDPVIVPDIETSHFMAGTADLDHSRRSGIRAVQSTPLRSRSGELLGMLSTHWREPHVPPEASLRLFDVLARQAADLIERTRTEAHMAMLADEVEHRAKNLFSMIEAVVRLSKSDSTEGLRQAITGRLLALANVHRLDLASRWKGAELTTIAREELSAHEQRARVEGPRIMLRAETAQCIGMVFHELVTNSAKYGALSASRGHVRVTWSDMTDGPARPALDGNRWPADQGSFTPGFRHSRHERDDQLGWWRCAFRLAG